MKDDRSWPGAKVPATGETEDSSDQQGNAEILEVPVKPEVAEGNERKTKEAKAVVDEPLAVRFSPKAYEQLQQLARRKHKTVSETVRDALALEQWVEEMKSSGGRVLVERNGRLEELVSV